MGRLRIGPPPEEQGDFDFAIHHMLPFRHGGVEVEDVDIAPPPEVNAEAASQPVNPGFSPLWHVPAPQPLDFRPVAPPLAGGPPAGERRPAARTAPVSIPPSQAVVEAARESPPQAVPISAPPVVRPSPAPTVERLKPPAARAAPEVLIEEEAKPSIFQALDPLYALALYLAAALGSLLAIGDLETRYTILWSILVLMGSALTLMDSRRMRRGVGSLNMAWGIGYGALIGTLLLVFVSQGLATTSRLLFPETRYTLPSLFQSLVLLGPLGETVFFRGMLQERRGIVASIVGAGLGTLLFYWPAGGNAIATVLAVAAFLTALAGLYSYIRQRYGLAAAYVCQVTLNLMLFFLPRLLISARP